MHTVVKRPNTSLGRTAKRFFLKHRFALLAAIAALCAICILSIAWFCFLSAEADGLAVLYRTGFFLSIAIIAFCFAIKGRMAGRKPEKLYLVILLCLTCVSSWVYGTNEVSWDIDSHFRSVVNYSDPYRHSAYTEAEVSMITRSLDMDESDSRYSYLIDKMQSRDGSIGFGYIHVWVDTNALQLRNELLDELDKIPDDSDYVRHAPLSSIYDKVAYLPSAVVYFICTLLAIPFSVKFVLSKMAGAIIFSLILYCGMKKLRSGKLIYATISLYPTSVFLAANYSYDYWVNAWTLYAVAIIVGQLQRPDKTFLKREQIALLASFVIGLLPKAIYFPLLLLCFFIPKEKFKTRKGATLFRICTIGSLLVVLMSFAVPFLLATESRADLRGGSDVSAGGQIEFILSNPLSYAAICLNSTFSYLSFDKTQNYVNLFAYLDRGSDVVWLLIICITFFVALTDTKFDRYPEFTWKKRVFVICLSLGIIVLIETALYVSFTSVGKDAVSGVQGRYLLPLLFPLLVFLGTCKTSWPKRTLWKTYVNAAVLALLCITNYASLWETYVGYLY